MDTATRVRRSNNDALLTEIVAFCQRAGMAESTFGRRAVNDGKFVPRLRFGGRVTTQTVERVHAFMEDVHRRGREDAAVRDRTTTTAAHSPVGDAAGGGELHISAKVDNGTRRM